MYSFFFFRLRIGRFGDSYTESVEDFDYVRREGAALMLLSGGNRCNGDGSLGAWPFLKEFKRKFYELG